MVQPIIRETLVGPFSSVECQPVIQSGWSDHPMVKMPGQQFWAELAAKLWPIRGERCVGLLRTNARKDEMTEEAKKAASPASSTDK